jgi:hypothetical protein
LFAPVQRQLQFDQHFRDDRAELFRQLNLGERGGGLRVHALQQAGQDLLLDLVQAYVEAGRLRRQIGGPVGAIRQPGHRVAAALRVARIHQRTRRSRLEPRRAQVRLVVCRGEGGFGHCGIDARLVPPDRLGNTECGPSARHGTETGLASESVHSCPRCGAFLSVTKEVPSATSRIRHKRHRREMVNRPKSLKQF